MDGNLTGTHWVRAGRWALQDAHKWLPKKKDFAALRRHALKLRFWPNHHPENDDGQLLDLNWSWIRALPGKRIGELRIDDTIGGCDNLRVIFFVPREETEPPMLWVLAAFQKKRDDFSKAQIQTFKGRRELILERFYRNP